MVHVRTKADEAALKYGFYFNEDEATRAVAFFRKYLSIQNQPFTPLPWQEQVIRDLHGWKRPDGTFRFKKAFVSTAKKSGKTELNSGLSLLHLIGKYEPRPFVVCVANDREQAGQIYDNIEYYVKYNRPLRDCLSLVPSQRLIRYPKQDGKFKVLSNEASGKFGHGYSFISLDEICLWPNSKLYNAIQYASISRVQPIHCAISTAGYDQTDNNPGYRLYQYAKTILDGSNTDPDFYAAIWETPPDADLDDPATWQLANPALGVTQKVETFRADWTRAKASKAEYLEFLRFRFNIWTKQREQWLDLREWDQCKGDPQFGDAPCFIGLDLSSTFDLTSLSLVSAPINSKHHVRNWNWTTSIACQEREKRNLTKYDVFSAEGVLSVFNGNAIEYDAIRSFILDLRERYNVAGIVIEKWNWLALAQQLEKDGFQILPFPGSISYYNAPTKQLELLVRERRLVHDGNSLLRWAVQNTSLEVDSNGNCRPKRQTEGEKIDPVVSVILGLSAAMQADKLYQPTSCVYDQRGIMTI